MKKKQFLNEVERIAEDLGWNVTIDNNSINFQQYTTQGQDFDVEIHFEDHKDIPMLVHEYHDGYDPVEEAKVWHGQNRGEPEDFEDILKDMKECKYYLRSLYVSLESILENDDEYEREFAVRVKYIFSGTYTVKARSISEAEVIVMNGCGAVGIKPHTIDARVIDWDFDLRPEQKIGN